MNYRILAQLAFLLASATFAAAGNPTHAEYRVLPAVTKGNLSIFPVVGGSEYATPQFLTLDEGLRNGTVVVTEAGSLRGLVRPGMPIQRQSGAEVNRLVLINNSDRPLLLLAGEIVTGGKQDRVIGAGPHRPAQVGPDRSFGLLRRARTLGGFVGPLWHLKSQMAQPSVRMPAMAERNQQSVWEHVASAVGGMAGAVPAAAPAMQSSTSYAKAMENPEVEKRVGLVASDYDSLLRELRKVGAKGVVVAINGRITWADVFASTDLLEKYWQKLIRSYAAESLTNVGAGGQADQKSAQVFLDQVHGNREVTETEPGIFRRTEISGDGYKVFTLTSLLPKTDYIVHFAKMSYSGSSQPLLVPMGLRR